MTAEPNPMTNEERFAILRSVGEECIQESELRGLIEKKPDIRCYDGFEPSGRMHIAQGVFKAINVNKCTSCGCTFFFWLADWFALMNDKLGGDIENIRTVGKYFIEVWKALGMDMSHVKFLWASDEITKHGEVYWKQVLDIGRRNTISRIKKCCTIMGKAESSMTCAQVLYPLMQCSDIFFLRADICQLGLDQRKVNMLAREYCDLIGRKHKPVILSHHMMSGLKFGQAKMSKSDPDSAIFVEDSAEEIERKVCQAYCPRVAQKRAEITDDGAAQKNEDTNPILDYYRHIVFARPHATSILHGHTFSTYDELENAFVSGVLSEEQLKEGLIREINFLLEPVRRHFADDASARDLLVQIKSIAGGGNKPTAPILPTPKGAKAPHACLWLPPVLRLTLDTANSILDVIDTFLQQHNNATVSVILPEWSAFASDEITGDEKDIQATLAYNLELLKAYGLPTVVNVVHEKELILANSNDFWVTVINVGRGNSLTYVEELYGGVKNAGQPISALMRVADAVILEATHIINLPSDCKLSVLAERFTNGFVKSIQASCGGILSLNNPLDATTSLPEPQPRVNTESFLYLDDNEMDIRRKIKKAYCAPNESWNPIIAIASRILSKCGILCITRSEANGGNISYSLLEALQTDCSSGALHPADVKAAVRDRLLELTSNVRAALATPQLTDLARAVRKVENKLKKK